ncbi:MAG: type II toxin-antitoxin system VapC family toxin [Thiolinea sp.]
MIILDTNVVSEPLRRLPEQRVIEWIDAQVIETLYLTSITVAELRFGVQILPAGKRRDDLSANLEQRVLPLFFGRILAFDMPVTAYYAEKMAQARASGLAVSSSDGYIAAIAAANNMAVATRDVQPFAAMGVRVINPWEA